MNRVPCSSCWYFLRVVPEESVAGIIKRKSGKCGWGKQNYCLLFNQSINRMKPTTIVSPWKMEWCIFIWLVISLVGVYFWSDSFLLRNRILRSSFLFAYYIQVLCACLAALFSVSANIIRIRLFSINLLRLSVTIYIYNVVGAWIMVERQIDRFP